MTKAARAALRLGLEVHPEANIAPGTARKLLDALDDAEAVIEASRRKQKNDPYSCTRREFLHIRPCDCDDCALTVALDAYDAKHGGGG